MAEPNPTDQLIEALIDRVAILEKIILEFVQNSYISAEAAIKTYKAHDYKKLYISYLKSKG